MIFIATAITFFVIGWWLRWMYSIAYDSFLMERQHKIVRKLERENDRLRKQLYPHEYSD